MDSMEKSALIKGAQQKSWYYSEKKVKLERPEEHQQFLKMTG